MADYLKLIRSIDDGKIMLELYDANEETEDDVVLLKSVLKNNENLQALVWLCGEEMWLHWANGVNVYVDIWGLKKPHKKDILYWMTLLINQI